MSLIFIIVLSFIVALQGSLFVHFMQLCINLFNTTPALAFSLPLIGVFTVWTYKKVSPQILTTKLLIMSLYNSDRIIHFTLSPLVIFFSSLSQLGGAATGREGSALQIGAASADLLWSRMKPRFDRSTALRAGMAAGMGAIFAAPLAGAVFAFEISKTKKNWVHLIIYFLSSQLGNVFSRYFQSPRLNLPQIGLIPWEISFLWKLPVLAILLAAAAWLFSTSYHQIEKVFQKFSPYKSVIIGSTLIALATYFSQTTRYNGLGTNLLDESLRFETSSLDAFIKSLFTLISATCGLKGGEVTPLLAIGSVVGAGFGQWIDFVHPIFPAVSACVLFGAITGVPLCSAFLAVDLFGWDLFIPTLVLSVLCNFFSSKNKLFISEL